MATDKYDTIDEQFCHQSDAYKGSRSTITLNAVQGWTTEHWEAEAGDGDSMSFI